MIKVASWRGIAWEKSVWGFGSVSLINLSDGLTDSCRDEQLTSICRRRTAGWKNDKRRDWERAGKEQWETQQMKSARERLNKLLTCGCTSLASQKTQTQPTNPRSCSFITYWCNRVLNHLSFKYEISHNVRKLDLFWGCALTGLCSVLLSSCGCLLSQVKRMHLNGIMN